MKAFILAGGFCTLGKQSRDFLHVDDVADALVTVLEHDVTGTINIASGQSVQIKELAAIHYTFLNNHHFLKNPLRIIIIPIN